MNGAFGFGERGDVLSTAMSAKTTTRPVRREPATGVFRMDFFVEAGNGFESICWRGAFANEYGDRDAPVDARGELTLAALFKSTELSRLFRGVFLCKKMY